MGVITEAVFRRGPARIIDLNAYAKDHYTKIRKSLVNGQFVHANMRAKLEKRLKTCRNIIHQFARQDHATYQFTLNTTKKFGDPLRDFLPSWAICGDEWTHEVDFTEHADEPSFTVEPVNFFRQTS